jgi:fructosamine-3-kinase
MSIELPEGPDGITSAWVSQALSGGSDLSVQVTEVSVDPIGTGQTGSSFRVSVLYAEETDLPRTFVAKLPAEEASVRERVASGYRAEVAFYEIVAPTVHVPLPRCYYSAISDNSESFVLLLEDLTPARQGDQLAGCSGQQAHAAVTALAGLHGPRWCDPHWHSLQAVVMAMADENGAKGLGEIVRMAVDMFLERLGHRMKEPDRQTLDACPDRVAPWLLSKPDRFSLLHGDYRLDNLMFGPGDTSVTVVDWQTLGVGLPARDLAYFIATGMAPEVRATEERALVVAYHAALEGWGVQSYEVEECFDDYRRSAARSRHLHTWGGLFNHN